MTDDRVAIGLRAHSGWAAMVALAESPGKLAIVERRRINLADPQVPGFPQPYHAAEEAPPVKARQLVDACIVACRRLAEEGIRSAVEDLNERRLKVVACGILAVRQV
jgi:NAD(P)H-hydrate repair Nnr-like enzyme with NAD(P)H-hydrate epimerase domain